MRLVLLLLWLTVVRLCVCYDSNELEHSSTHRTPTGNDRCDCKCTKTESSSQTCGEGLCGCTDNDADCSGHCCGDQSLTYIPALPLGTSHLDFSCNKLSYIPYDFFDNVTHLQSLHLQENNLRLISPRAFRKLLFLTTLYIGGNDQIPFTGLRTVLSLTQLEDLDMSNCNISRFPNLFSYVSLPRLTTLLLFQNQLTRLSFLYTDMPSLQYLFLTRNMIEYFSFGQFSRFTALTEFYLDFNRLSFLDIPSVLYLEALSFDENRLPVFPKTCDNSSNTLFPNLVHLALSNNRIDFIPKTVCLPKLHWLDLKNNNFGTIHENSFNGMNFPQLGFLAVTARIGLLGFSVENGALNNLTFLKTVNLKHNFVFLNICGKFLNCPRLSRLDLSTNFFSFPVCHAPSETRACENITYLDVSSSKIRRIRQNFLHCFTNLTHLLMQDNALTNIPEGAFDSFLHLTNLDVSANRITVVSPDTFSVVTRERLVSLELSGNPFQCSCDLLWFKHWMKTSPDVFENDFYHYDCANIQGETVRQFVLSEQACMLSKSSSVMVIYTITIVIVLFTTVSAVFRYRWHLRLLLYEVFRGRGEIRRQLLINGNFDYDVFVSYDSEDSLWVRQHLMPELEDRLGLRLCLHERDFIPGRDIVNNIATMVQRSKKVLMVFSDAFVASQWCQFELSFCLQHAMDTEDALIIVCVDDVASRDMTAAMTAVLKTTTYIQWVDGNGDATRAFWGRLLAALQEIYGEAAV